MKKFLQLILTFTILVCLASCKGEDGEDGAPGPAGPAGPTGAIGPQGPPGASADSARVFDAGDINFTPDADGNFQVGIEYEANEIEVGPTDVVLVYYLVGTAANGTIPFWSPLPQTFFYSNGQPFTYSYAYSNVALILTLTAQFDLAEAGKDYTAITNNNTYRFVIIPSRAGRTTGEPITKADLNKYPIDLNNYSEVVKYFKINDTNVRKISLK
ncbi:hypothetical protein [Adhaeribacter radiodurans]|uniref:Collagen-like protein n=1 Tax=Adhaeribacter radiodurans TaxID=2745197 RepID=A0A7L7LC96_9BACT|nr:hypothetical protein [Adhaeribacter radiodurans]QMU30165.1 hypothetical protein HUW48_19965 [Adhaeribacter radiodurans]